MLTGDELTGIEESPTCAVIAEDAQTRTSRGIIKSFIQIFASRNPNVVPLSK